MFYKFVKDNIHPETQSDFNNAKNDIGDDNIGKYKNTTTKRKVNSK